MMMTIIIIIITITHIIHYHHHHHHKTPCRMLDGVAVGAKESLKAEWMYRWAIIIVHNQKVDVYYTL